MSDLSIEDFDGIDSYIIGASRDGKDAYEVDSLALEALSRTLRLLRQLPPDDLWWVYKRVLWIGNYIGEALAATTLDEKRASLDKAYDEYVEAVALFEESR